MVVWRIFCMIMCVWLFLYLGLYENVDKYDLYEAGFSWDVMSLTYDFNEDAGDINEFNYTWS